MTDVTKDWAGGEPERETSDPTAPAPNTSELIPDTGDHTPPAATKPAESRSFGTDATSQSKSRASKAAQGGADTASSQAMSDEESLLRASLETIRVKAEELRGQAR